MKGKVLVTDPVHPLLLKGLLDMGFEPDYRPTIERFEVLDIISGYTGLIINSKILADVQLIDLAVHLEFIGRLGSGLEVIDQAYAKKKGIFFFNSPEGNKDAVAEHAVGMLLGLLNNIPKADREVRNYLWNREPNRGTELGGKTVGIIGFGHTGSAFAQRLSGFGVHILAYDKYKTGFATQQVKECGLDEIFDQADIVSLHVQLTEETKYMVNRAFIERLKKPVYLVNTSRGMVVDTHALVWALGEGKILGAALDVLEQEKLDKLTLQQQADFEELRKNDKVLLTPHIAGWTHESKEKIAELILYKLKDFAGGN